jgi:pimeloyl-ACP methyl ester carboxylesterase
MATSLLPGGTSVTVTNPTTHAKLAVKVFVSKDAAAKKLPALVLVPGGTGDSKAFEADAGRYNAAGLVLVIFDPDGRGQSTGTEDYDGYKQQDGLAAVIRFVATLPQVDAKKIGLVTHSYGIAMGSGVLARYPDLPVKFLIDWEGPSDRNYTTTGCRLDTRANRILWQPCTDNAWWSEREAVNFIGKLRVPYQRLQSERDHVQTTNAHAVDMINGAVKGGVSWVRLNDYPINQTYDPQAPPQMFPDSMDRQREASICQVCARVVESLRLASVST